MEEKKLHGPQGIMSIPSDCLVLKNVFDSTKAKVYDFFCDTKDWYTCDNGQSHHCQEFFFFFFPSNDYSIVIYCKGVKGFL